MARSTPGSSKNKASTTARPTFDGPARQAIGCKFILDDDGLGCRGPRWRYCQAPTSGAAQSYCPEHRKRVYYQEPLKKS